MKMCTKTSSNTCFRGHVRHRRHSCSAGGWGPPERCYPRNPSGLSGSRGDDDSPSPRIESSTHPEQTPDPG